MSRSASYAEMAVLRPCRPLVLTMGIDDVLCPAKADFFVRELTSTEQVLSILELEEASVLVLGPRLKAAGVRAILDRIASRARNPLTIVIGFGQEPEFLQEFVDSGLVFYISRGSLTPTQLHAVVTAAIHQYVRSHEEENFLVASETRMARTVEYGIRLLNQAEAGSVCDLLVEAIIEIIGANRAQCFLYDAEKETLSALGARERTESAASGIVAFAARTGLLIELERIGADSRYDREADNPEGSSEDRMIAAPVVSLKGVSMAVLVATRGFDSEVFSSNDIVAIKFLSDCASVPFSLIFASKRLERLLLNEKQSTDVFRREALDYHTGAKEVEGNLVQTSPAWLRRSHWLTIALLAASLIFLGVARVKEKADGVAIVRARNKITLAAAGGLVRSVEVAAGKSVGRGDLLVSFQDLRGTTGADQVHDQLRAPDDGVIGDVFVRAGQQVASGDPVATIIEQDAGYDLVGFVPGQYAAQLQHGMLGSFSVDGYPDSREIVEIDEVGPEIVGAQEAARYAGIADAALASPVVVVRCHLKSPHFTAGNRAYVYCDGMTARLKVDLSSEPMIVDLLPGLKEFIRHLK